MLTLLKSPFSVRFSGDMGFNKSGNLCGISLGNEFLLEDGVAPRESGGVGEGLSA